MKIAVRTFLFFLLSLALFSGYQLYARYDTIKQHAQEYIRNKPSMVGDYLSARFSANENDIETALSYYISALEKEPQNTDLLRQTYRLHFMLGNFTQAEPLIERHYQLDNTSETAVIFKATIDLKHARYESALNTVNNGLKNIKHFRQNDIKLLVMPMLKLWSLAGLNRFDEAYQLIKEDGTPQMAEFLELQHARLLIVEKKYNEAEAIISQQISDNSPFLNMINIASFYHLMGNTEKAQEVLTVLQQGNTPSASMDLVIANAPLLSTIQKAVADLYLEEAAFVSALRRTDDAITYLQTSRYLEPTNPYAQMVIAGMFEKKRDYQRANMIYNTIGTDSTFSRKARINIAINHNRMEKNQQAETLLRDIIAEDTTPQMDVMLTLGDILLRDKEYGKAAKVYSQLVDQWDTMDTEGFAPKWTLYYARGICYERLSEWTKSENDFLSALELSPRQPSVLNYLAYSWLTMDKNLEEAERMLKIAFSERPTDAHIMDSYGWALYKTGDFAGALTFIEKANLLLPHDITTNDHLGDIYWALGRKLEARFQWERAITLDPEHDDVEKIKAKLLSGIGTEFTLNKNLAPTTVQPATPLQE